MSHEPESTKETLILPDALIGKKVGPYEVRGLLGKGGMGVVYRAYDASLDREVALKILPPALSADKEYAERFEREARLAAKLDNARIVPVYAAGGDPHGAWIAMQLVRGRTLAEELRDGFRPTLPNTVKIARQIAEALGAAHKAGLVHRDIKPANLIVDAHGDVKVLDFGLARPAKSTGYTQDGTYLGTPEYSSPEQCQSNDVDGRSDLYSLGVVLYEMLGGKIPHVAETPLALFNKIVSEEPIPVRELNPNVSPSLAAVVAKLLAKNRDARYPDASSLIGDLERISIRDFPSSTRETRLVAAGPADKARVAAWTLAASLAALLVAAVIYSHPGATQATGDPGTGTTGASVNPAPVAAKRTGRIVFLDFKNLATSPEAGWMETGLPEMIASTLAQRPALNPLEREEVLAAMRREFNARLTSGGSDDPAAASAQGVRLLNALEAGVLVRGSFLAQGDDVRLMVTVFVLRGGSLEVVLNRHQETGSVRDVIRMADGAAGAIAATLGQAAPVTGLPKLGAADDAEKSRNQALAGDREPKSAKECLAALEKRRSSQGRAKDSLRRALAKANDAAADELDVKLKEARKEQDKLAKVEQKKTGGAAGGERGKDPQSRPDAPKAPPAEGAVKDPTKTEPPDTGAPANDPGGAGQEVEMNEENQNAHEDLVDEVEELGDLVEALKAWAEECREREFDLPVQELGVEGKVTK
ncbi:MAG: protein kinase [Planctomycetes bacterium]|nr:protein kinase [Planctomycetota bacterium]